MKKTLSLFIFTLVMISKSAYSQIQPLQPSICVTQTEQDFADLWRMYVQDMHDILLAGGYKGLPVTGAKNPNVVHLWGTGGPGLNQDATTRANSIATKLFTTSANNLSGRLIAYILQSDTYVLTPTQANADAWHELGNRIAAFFESQVINDSPIPASQIRAKIQQSLSVITESLILGFQAYASTTNTFTNTLAAQELTNQAIENAAELAVYLLSIKQNLNP